MRPVAKSALLALVVLVGNGGLWLAWLFLGKLYAGNSFLKLQQATFGVTATTGLAFLFGGVLVYRGARMFGASVGRRWVATLGYLAAAAIAVVVLFFYTGLALQPLLEPVGR